MSVRPPIFAEQGWYPHEREALSALLDTLVQPRPDQSPKRRFGVISPHAGYVYSGSVAGTLFAEVEVPDQVLLLTVNHRGIGPPAAVWNQGSWAIPGAEVPIDEALAAHLLERCPFLQADQSAHSMEHSGELQLPFLYRRNPKVRIVPISLRHLQKEDAMALGQQLHAALVDHAPDALWVASSDMNHFEDDATSRAKDAKALERALELDPAGLYQTVADHHISMCGVVPATVMLTAAVARGVTESQLVQYTNSGFKTGDNSSVVGYAGLTFDLPTPA